MFFVVALGAITGAINLLASDAELRELGFTPGGYMESSVDQMEELRLALENSRGNLPDPGGGSVTNTADLLARASVNCGFMGVGGDDTFGRVLSRILREPHLSFSLNLKTEPLRGMTSICSAMKVHALSS